MTKDRTLDIQFQNQADFNAIFPYLVIHIKYLIDRKSSNTEDKIMRAHV